MPDDFENMSPELENMSPSIYKDVDFKDPIQTEPSEPVWYSWNRYSQKTLFETEEKILKSLGVDYKAYYVEAGAHISKKDQLYTVELNSEAKKTPLVLLHGLGGGAAVWCMNLKEISQDRTVYAVDMIGFGRSTRPDFSIDGGYVEVQFVKMVEKWREAMKLDKFILMGHSLGGYVATSYSLKYPDHVQHLILADPWGFAGRPRTLPPPESTFAGYVDQALAYLNPFAPIRLAGPFGEWLISYSRPELMEKYKKLFDCGYLMPKYLYHLNARYPSGERGFWYMSNGFHYAKYPMMKRIEDLDKRIPITFLGGTKSMVDPKMAAQLEEKRQGSYFKKHIGDGVGHHVYVDYLPDFNKYVVEACRYTDSQEARSSRS